MDREQIRITRGRVIENFVAIEQMIAATVCWHYLGHEDLDFILNIFGNDQANFSFKRNVFLHIYELENTDFAHKLNRLNKIRNLFIYSPLVANSVEYKDFFFRDPENDNPVNTKIDPNALFQEFEKYLSQFIQLYHTVFTGILWILYLTYECIGDTKFNSKHRLT